jgi:hypothetical protein
VRPSKNRASPIYLSFVGANALSGIGPPYASIILLAELIRRALFLGCAEQQSLRARHMTSAKQYAHYDQ